MSDYYNIYCRRGYGPIPGQTAGDPRSPPHNQGQPLGNMRSPPGNPPYGTPPGNQFNPGPQYQPAPGPMNQAGGRQVKLCVLRKVMFVFVCMWCVSN